MNVIAILIDEKKRIILPKFNSKALNVFLQDDRKDDEIPYETFVRIVGKVGICQNDFGNVEKVLTIEKPSGRRIVFLSKIKNTKKIDKLREEGKIDRLALKNVNEIFNIFDKVNCDFDLPLQYNYEYEYIINEVNNIIERK